MTHNAACAWFARLTITYLLTLTGCAGESTAVPAPAPAPEDECIDNPPGLLMHDVHEGMLVRVAHPPGSGQVYAADGAHVEIVELVQWYATLRFTNVRSSTVLLAVRAFEGGDVLCVEVERVQ